MAEDVPTALGRLSLVRAPLLAAAGVGAAWTLVVLFDPNHTHVPLCPLNAFTGLDCPFCGGLRAADDLARGHLGAALGSNALFVAVLPLLALAWGRWLAARSRGVNAPLVAAGSRVPILLISAALVFAVVRNLAFGAALAA